MKSIPWLLVMAAAVLLVPFSGCRDGGEEGGFKPCIGPPGTPADLYPPDGASGVATRIDLSWTGGESSCALLVTYDVYLGTYSPPPLVGSTGNRTFRPDRLDPNTLYYWRIVARDAVGATESAVYRLTTGEHSCLLPPTPPAEPWPSSSAAGVSIGAILSWLGGGSPCDLPVAYDVFLGTSYPPPKVATVTQKAYDPGLSYNTHFYWRVVARDGNGSTSGPDWDFITAQQEYVVISAALNLRIREENDNGAALAVHECTEVWNEGSLTWKNAPAWFPHVLDRGSRYSQMDGSTWMQFSIPAHVVEYWASAPALNRGLAIDDDRRTYPGLDTCTEFYTKESKGGCFNPDPYLEVTWRRPGGTSRVSLFYPDNDTWAYDAAPDAVRGTRTTMWAGWGTWGSLGAASSARAFVHFPVQLN